MTRLLMVTTVVDTLDAFLLPFASHFRAQGWRVDAMAHNVSTSSQSREAFDHTWEVTWSRNPLDPRNMFRTPKAIRALVKREGYDIVHVHTPVSAFVTRYALRGLRKKGRPRVIYTAHGFHFYDKGGHPLKNALFLALEKAAGYWTDYVVVINHEDEMAARRLRLVPPARVRYMPGIGVDTGFYRPKDTLSTEAEQVRREIGLQAGEKLLVMVAEFIPRKRHQDAVRAVARLSRPDIHLAFAGEGPLIDSVQALAESLGVQDRVHFLGYRDDVPALMRASIATVLCSEQEGLPRSVMESLSLQVPVIGSDIRGTRELLEGGCGLLVELGNVQGLADATAWMADHAREARAMGRRGRERMAAFDIKNIMALHVNLYQEALA